MSDLHFGGCACGTVRYRVHGMPSVSTVCHCRFCQRRLASAFAVLATFPEQSVEITQGELAECEHRSDESGRWLKMRFCPTCGTRLPRPAQRSGKLPLSCPCAITTQRTRTRARVPCFAKVTGRAPVAANVRPTTKPTARKEKRK